MDSTGFEGETKETIGNTVTSLQSHSHRIHGETPSSPSILPVFGREESSLDFVIRVYEMGPKVSERASMEEKQCCNRPETNKKERGAKSAALLVRETAIAIGEKRGRKAELKKLLYIYIFFPKF